MKIIQIFYLVKWGPSIQMEYCMKTSTKNVK